MKVGIVQLCSKLDYKENLEKIRNLLEVFSLNLDAIFLPECFYSMSDGTKPTPYLVEGENEHFQNIQRLAKDFNAYLLGGSAATLNENGQVVNRVYNFDPVGKLIGTYDKIHLFSCDIFKNGIRKKIDEGDIYTSGNTPSITDLGRWKMGNSVCFDLRFPSMYQDYLMQGCNLFSASAAFTVPTGKAHWHTLVRARAIETQSFFIAAAQVGHNNDRIQTYGHSLIVNPWGEVLADAKEEETLISAILNFNQIQEVRQSVKLR